MSRRLHLAAPFLLLLVCSSPVTAQERTLADTLGPASVDTAAGAAQPVSPRGAFIRSLLVPGWGQASLGAYFRGGVYFAAQTGSWYMLLKTMARLGEARSIEERRVANARRSLLVRAQQDTARQRRYADPDSLAADIAADEGVLSIRGLVDARKEQREDWIALTIFWTFASAVDAYVNAHLADFPAGLAAEPRPDGGMELRVSVPVGGKP